MITVVLVIHLLVAIALVCLVLLQRSEGGALGIGGSGGGMGGFLTGRGTANLLTRTTAILAAVFILTSLVLARLAGGERVTRSIIDEPSPPAIDSPAPPAEPSAPIAR
jgi:preprotein translocase subunit SecG